EREIAQKAGMELSKALEAARAKCEGLRDPTKVAWADVAPQICSRIYYLETLRFDHKLTPAEADELEELRRRYPERAEKTRSTVVRRLSEHRDRRRLGFTSSDDGWPRMNFIPPVSDFAQPITALSPEI